MIREAGRGGEGRDDERDDARLCVGQAGDVARTPGGSMPGTSREKVTQVRETRGYLANLPLGTVL